MAHFNLKLNFNMACGASPRTWRLPSNNDAAMAAADADGDSDGDDM